MFTIQIPPDHAVLLKGPAEVECEVGCRVFGGFFRRFKIPPYRQYPVEGPAVVKTSGGSVELVAGSPIPRDWDIPLEGALVVVGPPDSGKSGFSTYLLNVKMSVGGCVIDADVGQSDIGLPGFVSCGCAAEPVVHISELEPLGAYFVGSTSPRGVEDLIVAGVTYCVRQVSPPLVINTPGWTSGRGLQLLKAIADAVGARVVNMGEMYLPGVVVSKPSRAAMRSVEERRQWRNYLYRKIALRHRITTELDKLTHCKWERGLTCPWGRYVERNVEKPERENHLSIVPPGYLKNLFAALYKSGKLVGYGVVEKFEPQLSLYCTTDDFDEVKVGKIRINPQTLEELEPLP